MDTHNSQCPMGVGALKLGKFYVMIYSTFTARVSCLNTYSGVTCITSWYILWDNARGSGSYSASYSASDCQHVAKFPMLTCS